MREDSWMLEVFDYLSCDRNSSTAAAFNYTYTYLLSSVDLLKTHKFVIFVPAEECVDSILNKICQRLLTTGMYGGK